MSANDNGSTGIRNHINKTQNSKGNITFSDNVYNCTVMNGSVNVLKPSFQVPFCASLEPQLLIQTVGYYHKFAEDAVKLERHNLVRN